MAVAFEGRDENQGWVNMEPSGPGETFLYHDNSTWFEDWHRISMNVTPAAAMRTFGHLEASGASRPGDGPVIWGLNGAEIRAGSPEAANIYGRMHEASEHQGRAYDADIVVSAPDPDLPDGWHYETLPNGQKIAVGGSTPSPGMGPAGPVPEDDGLSLFGALKGASRWLLAAVDVVSGEGWNSLIRAANYVARGDLTPGEAIAGLTQGMPVAGLAGMLTGLFGDYSEEDYEKFGEMVGLPFFRYMRSGLEGERINMGTGWYATGEIAPDISEQLSQYDAETHGNVIGQEEGSGLFGWFGKHPIHDQSGLTQEDFERQRELMGGRLRVMGLDGREHVANNLDEWKFLRDRVGRAALLSELTHNSPTQEALGQPHGTFQKQIFDPASVARRYGSGNYFSTSYGRVLASVTHNPDYDPAMSAYDWVSGSLDFGNQIMDLTVALKPLKLINGTNRFIGLSGEAGSLAQGTSTLVRMVEMADAPARVNALADAQRGTINVDLAANALARFNDTPLRGAVDHLHQARRQAGSLSSTATADNVDLLVDRAARGNVPAQRIVGELLRRAGVEDVDGALANLLAVQAREGTDLTKGVMGTAQVSDEVLTAARNQAESLNSLINDGRASVVFDPSNGKQMLTFDADIGRAQQTLIGINDGLRVQIAGRQAAASGYQAAVQRFDNVVSSGPGREVIEARIRVQQAAGALGREVAAQQRELRRLRDARAGNLYTDAGRVSAARDELDEARRAYDQLEGAYGQSIADARQAMLDAASDANLKGIVDPTTGQVLDGRRLGAWSRLNVDEATAAAQKQMTDGLFKENWMMARRAANLLGDSEETGSAIENLMRVLRRSDTDGLLTEGGARARPRLNNSQLNKLLTGGSKARQMVDALAAAKTHDEVLAILKPTVEHSGHLPPVLVDALHLADTPDQVVEAMMRYGAGQMLLTPKMGLLGRASRFGTYSTSAGILGGGVAGAVGEFQDPDAEVLDIIGGGISGAILGAMGGSALAGGGGWLAGSATRSIEDVADAMDLLLAGARSATTDAIRARGVEMGLAQAGLSIPSQMGYAFAHSPLGRRLARGVDTNLSLNDPVDFYYKLGDYAHALGLRLTDKAEIWQKGKGATAERASIIVSRMDEAAANAERARLAGEGYKLTRTSDMNDVMSRAANMLSNNTGRAHELLIRFGQVADAVLASRGMNQARIDMLTNSFRDSAQEFLGVTNAAGVPSGYMQQAILGDVVANLSDSAKLDSEMWSGHLDLPSPDRVFRAVAQLDGVGRTVQLFTGAGVVKQVRQNMTRLGKGEGWQRITPDLERNILNRSARMVVQGLWAPAILLGRFGAFASRVLGEDQFRMTAASLNSFFSHAGSYLSAIAANFKTLKNLNLRPFGIEGVAKYGIASRADLARIGWIDKDGNVIEDALDEMGQWGLAESIRHQLAIYNREVAETRKASIFGSRAWVPIRLDEPGGMDGLTTEFRQLVHSPIMRYMARSQSDDVVADTANWLTNTTEGRAVATNWARQFNTEADARRWMERDAMEAFLHDQYARLHLKAGGDWVFVIRPGVVLDSTNGVPISPDILKAKGWENLEPGYHIYRKGDEEILDVVGKGTLRIQEDLVDDAGERVIDLTTQEAFQVERDIRIHDRLTDEKWEHMQAFLRKKKQEFDRGLAKKGADPVQSKQFPPIVKGEKVRLDNTQYGGKGIMGAMDDLVDRMFDFWLGKPSRVFSRQPTLGGFFWERIGMLMPSMTDEMETAFRRLAQKEGALGEVDRIAAEFRANGPAARGTLDNVEQIDLNAKAYAIERTRDILFDLHRQRNFVDGMRLIFPFAGPFVEALEAWGRVIKRDPYKVWRRASQVSSHLWDTSGVGDPPDPMGQGWFWTDPETGQQMFQYPFASAMFPGVLGGLSEGNVDMTDIEAKATQLNVVFGPDDLTQGAGPEISGVPLQALNPGMSPLMAIGAPMFWQNRTGVQREIYEFMFPYGEPESLSAALLPYNLRKAFDGFAGWLGHNSEEMTRNTADQYGRMMANGEIGPGRKYDTDLPGGSDEAWEEAQNRAVGATLMEAVARTVLPAMVTPEVKAEIDADPRLKGVDLEPLITIEAMGNWAYDLTTPEGSQWWQTPDGYQLSTEGDWEVTTAYMNEMLGLDMFSAEFLSIPLTDRAFPVVYTDEGLDWQRTHTGVLDKWKSTGTFLMPGYAAAKAKEDEDFNFEAYDSAVARGDASIYTFDEQKEQLQSRLLKMRYGQIEREAEMQFGSDEALEGEAQDQKDWWVADQKEQAAAGFRGGDVNESQRKAVFDELLGWADEDWDWEAQGLTPQELATVDAVRWYLDVRAQATMAMRSQGIGGLDHKGSGEDQQAFARAVREDVRRIVATQFDTAQRNNFDMGNFRYLWTLYLEPEVLEKEEDFDALTELARLRAGDYGFEELPRYMPELTGNLPATSTQETETYGG